jgi:Homeodomain-like domain-containing protein
MRRVSSNSRNVAAVKRGQIIQRVLVDGWSPAEVAAVNGIAERQVVRWLATYRRHGMASLRRDADAEPPPRWMRRLRSLVMRLSAALRGADGGQTARCVALPRKDGRRPSLAADRRRSGTESLSAP